jgi:hypothetical protein
LYVDTTLLKRCTHAFLVVDDEPEVPSSIARLAASCCKRDELVSHVDEGHRRAGPTSQLELEVASVPGERFVDVTDLERNVVDPNEARHRIRP